MANPIEARFDQLSDEWADFMAKPKARVLRWLVAPDEVSMVTTFFAREMDADTAELPEGFIELDTPFADARRHGNALAKSLAARHAEAAAALADEGVSVSWTPPAPEPAGDDVAAFLQTLASFKAAHGPEEAALAVVLSPSAVSQTAAYAAWLGRLAVAAPQDLRFVVLDAVDAPALEALASLPNEVVTTTTAGLDMPAAAAELSQDAGNLDSPGGRFRQLFAGIGEAGKAGDLPRARALSDEAAAVASGAGMLPLAMAARFALGAVLGQAGQHAEAARSFENAEKEAVDAETAGDATGPRLQLQSRLARGSSLIAMGAFPQGAAHFSATVPLARKVGDQRAEVDCHRLASYCHEQSGQIDEAWSVGLTGLKLGKDMDAETRRTSTLPYLAEQMMRLTNQRKLRDNAAPLEQQIVSLLGKSWRPSGTAPPTA